MLSEPLMSASRFVSVFLIVIVEVVQTVFSILNLWYYSVGIWGDETSLVTKVPWSGAIISPLSGLGELSLYL